MSIFVTTPTDLPVIREAIHCYERATAARFNTRKSKALAMGGWSTTTATLDIPYHTEVKNVGVIFTSTIEMSMNRTWAKVTGKVRAQTNETYGRDVRLSKRIRQCKHTS